MNNPKFDFTPSLKKNLLIMMGIGGVGLLLAFIAFGENQHARFWTNILSNIYYFTGISLFGLFIVAAGQIAYGSWQTLEKRIFLSIGAFASIGGFLLLGILLLGYAHVHSLYNPVFNILKTGKDNPIYTTKLVYFAPIFWFSRVLVYSILWFLFSRALNNFFARTDQTDPKVYKRSKMLCAAFIVVFALTESFISWDVVMSLDPQWFSTLFGWYNFASYGCAALAMTILLVIFLKSKGYLEAINENHVHDLGKLLFGFSIFWTYLWFDQFMLQWYANIPEETAFWVKRMDNTYFTATIFIALIINFGFPLLFLINRSSKRNFRMIGFGAALLIFGHYIDFFNYTFVEPNWNKEVQEAKEAKRDAKLESRFAAVYPNEAATKEAPATETKATAETATAPAGEMKGEKKEGGEAKKGKEEEAAAPVENYAGIGLIEILVFIGFLGVFLYMFFANLSKRPIIPENDPYLKEAEKLTVTYA